jgi:transmembrane sensor
MNSNEEQMRTAIAGQAGEWYVANDEGSLDARDAAAMAAWFKTSPVHIEEFFGVAAVARDLKQARAYPEYSLEAILMRARAESAVPIQRLWPRVTEAVLGKPFGGWFPAAATMVIALVAAATLWLWNLRPSEHAAVPESVTALQLATRHGEQLRQRLADNSVLYLNTDSAVSIRLSKRERLVVLNAGQATFEVAHEIHRPFRVHAGSADILDLGTKFDVRLDQGSTVVTVVEGRVAVGARNANLSHLPQAIELSANQQIRVVGGQLPATPVAVDAEHTTAWLHRQITFKNEPLERVAAEFNRYLAKPIEIATPSLRSLRISGVFATDDTEAFIAFLRSLKGVRVEVTATGIRVSRDKA